MQASGTGGATTGGSIGQTNIGGAANAAIPGAAASSANTGGATNLFDTGGSTGSVNPTPQLPKFNFTFKDPIALTDMKTALTVPAYETLLGILEVPTQVTGGVTEVIGTPDTDSISYQEIYSMIDSKIAENTNTIIENTTSQENAYISLGGVIVPVNENHDMSGSSYQICPNTYRRDIITWERHVNFHLSLIVDDSS